MTKINRVQVLHNPGAGSESITEEQLMAIVETTGWESDYTSTKDNWGIDQSADLVIAAGGDGTIRKVAAAFMELDQSPLMGILPLGTANNLATSLGIGKDIEKAISSWQAGDAKVVEFNTGIVNNPVVSDFFIEGVGFGIFPKMISNMKKKFPGGSGSPEDSLQRSLQGMYDTTNDYETSSCRIIIDGKDYSGDLLLIEIMNIRSVGPNLLFAPEAQHGDKMFDIVLAKASDRSRLKAYFKSKINKETEETPLEVIRGKNITVNWCGSDFHLDDKLIDISEAANMDIGIHPRNLRFLVPGKS